MNRNNDHPLFSCILKLRRAYEHLEVLNSRMESFRQRNPHEIRVEVNSASQELLFWTRIREEPPPEWGPVVGDVVHNLRSALDHLACQLVIRNGREPTTHTSFPIFDRDPFTNATVGNKAWRSRVDGMSDENVAIIEDLQPYKRKNSPNPDETVENSILFVLNKFWNTDKHRELILMPVFYTGPKFDLERIEGYTVEAVEEMTAAPCENGTIVARYKIVSPAATADISNAHMDVNFDGVFEIGLVERDLHPTPFKVMEILRVMSARVADVIDGFADQFD